MMVANAANARIGRLPNLRVIGSQAKRPGTLTPCWFDCPSQLSNGPRRTMFRGPRARGQAPSVRDGWSRETLKRWFLARYAAPMGADVIG